MDLVPCSRSSSAYQADTRVIYGYLGLFRVISGYLGLFRVVRVTRCVMFRKFMIRMIRVG